MRDETSAAKDHKSETFVHSTRIEAYEHICKAALAVGGPVRPPAALLDPKQLSALFTQRQLDTLVARPH